jgi:F420-dependent oxidoreductase-like protein
VPTNYKPVNRISLFAQVSTSNSVAEVVSTVRTAARQGFGAIWLSQYDGIDSLIALAVAAREVPRIRLGTAVVPIQGRHPIPLAQQALTLSDAAGPGRFTLGIGVGHPFISDGWYGIPYEHVVSVCNEQIQALSSLLSVRREVDLVGAHLTARVKLALTAPPPGLVIAALGPRMVEIAGRFSDGAVTWMTGPRTLRARIGPALRRAAEMDGRPEPRLIVGLPICVTDDEGCARERLAPMMNESAKMPAYQRTLEEEGVTDPVDLALVGREDQVRETLEGIFDAGATEFLANVVGTQDEQARTRELLLLSAST